MVRILEYVFWITILIATALFMQTYLGHGILFGSHTTDGNYLVDLILSIFVAFVLLLALAAAIVIILTALSQLSDRLDTIITKSLEIISNYYLKLFQHDDNNDNTNANDYDY